MEHSNEADDWRAAVRGDGEAFGRLFDAHQPRVYRHALRLTGNAHDAEEVLAGAFLELWRRRKDVRVVDDSVLPWLLVTAGHLALNHGRGLRRYRALLARLPRQELTVAGADEQAMVRADLDLDPVLRSAITALSPTDQHLLALVALEDYSLRAAADALGITDQAARSGWQRIRRRLAQTNRQDPLTFALDH